VSPIHGEIPPRALIVCPRFVIEGRCDIFFNTPFKEEVRVVAPVDVDVYTLGIIDLFGGK